jgi:hydroxyacylglutathione hydrolase
MYFHQRFIPGLAIASYMIGDERTKEAAVIDPTRDVDEYILLAREHGLHIRHAFETHVHADFVSGAAELKSRIPGVSVHCSGMGGPEWTPPYADHVAKNGDEVRMGSVRLSALHTPGHTPEHVTWALYDESRSKEVPWLLLTGDFLFVGDVGRPDLLGEDARKALAHQLYTSVFETLPAIPDFTEIFPAHGAGSLCGKAIGSRRSSTIGFERHFNAALKPATERQWTENLLNGMPLAPPYFRRMKKVNAEGPKIIGPNLPGQQRMTARQVHEHLCDHCLILDIRPKEAFAAAHIPGSINIPLGPSLPTWAGWVLPYDKPTLIIPHHPHDVPDVITHLLRVGFDDVQAYLDDGIDAWQNLGYEVAQLQTLTVRDLAAQLKLPASQQPFVLDVRTENEWNAAHLDGAHHIHGGLLQERYNEIPKDRPIAVICGTGYRASIAASFLQHEGYPSVANVLGGVSGWCGAGLPVVK